jgi:hypothetical protein
MHSSDAGPHQDGGHQSPHQAEVAGNAVDLQAHMGVVSQRRSGPNIAPDTKPRATALQHCGIRGGCTDDNLRTAVMCSRGQGLTSVSAGRYRMIHISGGSQKVVGPVAIAPMKPSRSPKNGCAHKTWCDCSHISHDNSPQQTAAPSSSGPTLYI